LANARKAMPFHLAVPHDQGLGRPDQVGVRLAHGLASVTILYRPTDAFPPNPGSGAGLVLSEFGGSATPYFDKYVDLARPPVPVLVDGQWPGLWFRGPHATLVRDPDAMIHNVRPRLSAPALVWVRDDVTYRLEADIRWALAMRVAASVS
jgi:hypothetical protein